jgi:hypothetical protein
VGCVLLGIMIGLFLLLFIPSPNPVPISIPPSSFQSSCFTNPCEAGLICDPLNYTCKMNDGMTCQNGSDCLTTSFCSGVCVSTTMGLLDQPCPCINGLTCTSINGMSVCKKSTGSVCSSNGECASNNCDGTCKSGSVNAFSCNVDSDCASNHCSVGFCQPIGITTGNINSFCSGTCTGFTGSVCGSGLSCVCSGNSGTCSSIDNGLSVACGSGLMCSDIFECSASVCNFGIDPNDNDTCIGGMTRVNSVCKNNKTISCGSNSNCVSGSCTGPPTLSSYSIDGTLIGSTHISINPFASSSNFANPMSIQGRNDNAIYVHSSLGIVDMHGVILVPQYQSTNISGVLIEKRVIDFGLNQSLFIVAFLERHSSSIIVQNNTLYSGTQLTSLAPFNIQAGSGLDGTQYDVFGQSMSILGVNISEYNDVIITAPNTSGYIKPFNNFFYSQAIIQGGPRNGELVSAAKSKIGFYYDTTGISSNNLIFISTYPGVGGYVLQFSGNIAGFTTPYSDTFTYAISFSTAGILNENLISLSNGNIIITHAGISNTFPYSSNPNTLVLATQDVYFVLDGGSCI